MSRYRFDPQAFLLSSHDMEGIEFAALDTLQYGLAGDPEKAHCLVHRCAMWSKAASNAPAIGSA